MQAKSVCLFHRIFAFLFMKYHKFYTFCLNFVETDRKAGGFCGGGRPPRPLVPPRAASQVLAPLPALRAIPRPAATPSLRESPHPAPPLTLSKSASGPTGGGSLRGSPHPRRRPLCGKPRTLSRRPRYQNWPSGRSGTSHPAGIPAPCPAASAAFSLYWP